MSVTLWGRLQPTQAEMARMDYILEDSQHASGLVGCRTSNWSQHDMLTYCKATALTHSIMYWQLVTCAPCMIVSIQECQMEPEWL